MAILYRLCMRVIASMCAWQVANSTTKPRKTTRSAGHYAAPAALTRVVLRYVTVWLVVMRYPCPPPYLPNARQYSLLALKAQGDRLSVALSTGHSI